MFKFLNIEINLVPELNWLKKKIFFLLFLHNIYINKINHLNIGYNKDENQI